MPRYFFNVHGEWAATPDLVGRKLIDDEAAKQEARAVADDVARSKLSNAPLPDNQWVEVLDESLRAVTVIPVSGTAEDPSWSE